MAGKKTTTDAQPETTTEVPGERLRDFIAAVSDSTLGEHHYVTLSFMGVSMMVQAQRWPGATLFVLVGNPNIGPVYADEVDISGSTEAAVLNALGVGARRFAARYLNNLRGPDADLSL